MAQPKKYEAFVRAASEMTGGRLIDGKLTKAASSLARRGEQVTPQAIIAEYNRMAGAPGAQTFGPATPRMAADIPATPAAEGAVAGSRDPVPFDQRISASRPGMEERMVEEYPTLKGQTQGMTDRQFLDVYISPEDAIRKLRPQADDVANPGDNINMMGMDEGSYVGWPDNTPMARRTPVRKSVGELLEAARRPQAASPPPPTPAPPTRAVPPDQAVQENIGRQFDNMVSPGRRQEQPSRLLPASIAAATAAAAGLSQLYRPPVPPAGALDPLPEPDMPVADDEEMAIDSTDGAADLAAEATPPPEMPPEEEPPQPVDYSMQARAVINDLNARRRAAGGEVPEAQAMMAEANRLLEMGNQTRRATYVAAPGDDASSYFQQAQGLIDQLNAAYRQGTLTPNSPKAREVMAEVRRLQSMGDDLRNRRAG
jgi:hypothetical protein